MVESSSKLALQDSVLSSRKLPELLSLHLLPAAGQASLRQVCDQTCEEIHMAFGEGWIKDDRETTAQGDFAV